MYFRASWTMCLWVKRWRADHPEGALCIAAIGQSWGLVLEVACVDVSVARTSLGPTGPILRLDRRLWDLRSGLSGEAPWNRELP